MHLFAQLLLGFSSGLPLLAIGSTLKAWLTDAGIDLKTIAFFSTVAMPYTLKFLWAPLFDRYTLPFLGRRRGWLLLLQALLCLLFGQFFFLNPAQDLTQVAILAFLIALVSASQDIVVDALRRDSLKDEELGFGSALFVNGYRLGMLISGAGALFLSEVVPWNYVYPIVSAAFAIGAFGVFIMKEPQVQGGAPTTLVDAVILPFKDFFSHQNAALILAFIFFYKFGDALASELTVPFLKVGYSNGEIAAIAKTFGLGATLGGALIGGAAMFRLGIARSLWIFGLLQAVSTIAFAFQAHHAPSRPFLIAVIAFENLASGMGTAAYSAFMASLCNKRFSAAQFALLTSIMGVPRVVFGAATGVLAECLGWDGFFIFCAAAAFPGMLLLQKVAPWGNAAHPSEGARAAGPRT